MARLNWSLRPGQVEKIREYCKKHAEELGETPGFIWRRLIFSLVLLMTAKITPDQIRAGIQLLIDLDRRGCRFGRAGKKAGEITRIVNDDD